MSKPCIEIEQLENKMKLKGFSIVALLFSDI